jgi:hypothetical protein
MSHFMHKNCTWNLAQCLGIMNTSRDAINLIRPLHVYAKTENRKIKKELVATRTHYI